MSVNEILFRVGGATESNFPKLNYGGCGFYAYFVSKNLTKRNVKHTILALYCDGSGIIPEKPGEIGQNGFGHYAIKLHEDDELYDSSGYVLVSKRGQFRVFDWQLKAMLDNPINWNSDFDRNSVPELEEFINHQFDKLWNTDMKTEQKLHTVMAG